MLLIHTMQIDKGEVMRWILCLICILEMAVVDAQESRSSSWYEDEDYRENRRYMTNDYFYTNGRRPYYWGDYNLYYPGYYQGNYLYSRRNYQWQYPNNAYYFNYRNDTPYDHQVQ